MVNSSIGRGTTIWTRSPSRLSRRFRPERLLPSGRYPRDHGTNTAIEIAYQRSRCAFYLDQRSGTVLSYGGTVSLRRRFALDMIVGDEDLGDRRVRLVARETKVSVVPLRYRTNDR